MTSILISNKRRITEIAAVVLTAIGKFVFMDWLDWRFYFVVTAIVSWAFYIMYRSKSKPGILVHWGSRIDNYKKVFRKILPVGIISVIAFMGIGLYQDSIHYSWHIIPILIIYPVWVSFNSPY